MLISEIIVLPTDLHFLQTPRIDGILVYLKDYVYLLI